MFLCRSDRLSFVSRGVFSNSLPLAGVAVEITIILLIDYTPWGNMLFGTTALPLAVWIFVVPFAISMITLEEFRKWVCRTLSTPNHRKSATRQASPAR